MKTAASGVKIVLGCLVLKNFCSKDNFAKEKPSTSLWKGNTLFFSFYSKSLHASV